MLGSPGDVTLLTSAILCFLVPCNTLARHVSIPLGFE